ncbi:alpha/beta hydrolase [Deinococcus radiopugnans]|uniref:Alpha/beta hydrolase n=1 Tax=Deinococcus radiopugnans TaxID=57497 RepID=A0A0A7KGG6_9DEIO|nr:alpha/beta hydrolase [Deinococcus radiopugnans]AIZ44294.1 alpha/beta hydrolase [Deinococcus radiopugnans]
MVTETDLILEDGRTLHIYDTGAEGLSDPLTVFWHHGTPNIGAPPEPLFEASRQLNIRWVSHDRPGYGGSSPLPGRDIASAAWDVGQIADALDIAEFAVMGHSGGGPHALACAALLPERVLAAVSGAGLAPYGAEGLDYFGGMNPSGAASLRAALGGQAVKEAYEASAPEFDLETFTAADYAALSGSWKWLNSVVGPAMRDGPGGLIADDLAYVAPWGFAPAQIDVPVLLLHGAQDRVVPSTHADWLLRHLPTAELWPGPEDGHLSVLNSAGAALAWLRERADQAKAAR